MIWNAKICRGAGSEDYPIFYDCSELSSITIGENVKTIPAYAFYCCSRITSVTIPDGVTSIGERAFGYCRSLTSVTIGNGVTSIGRSAFYDCSKLKNIYITDLIAWCNISGLVNLMEYSSAKNFYLNNELVTNLTIPDSVTSIGRSVFYGCSSLTSVVIPDGVTSIGDSAFYGCSGLKNIYITDLTAWCNISGLNYLMNYGSSTKNFYLNNELVTNLTIPESVTSIGVCAFSGCSGLTSITIPNSVTSIGVGAFSGCSGLTSITIPDGVTSIGSSAFEGCSGLTSITIPDGVTSIGYYAFYKCYSLESITLPFIGKSKTASDGYDQVFGYIFGYTRTSSSKPISGATYQYSEDGFKYYYHIPENLKTVILSDNVTSIGSDVFNNCSSLTSITIGNGITSIGDDAFRGCRELKNIYITDLTAWVNISGLGDLMWYGSSTKNFYLNNELITHLIIPDGVNSIGVSAFRNCSGLTSITIPDGVTSIGNCAFSGCSSLTSVTIGNSVTSIGSSAFEGCSSLKTVFYKGTAAQWGKISIDYYNTNLTNTSRYYYSESEPALNSDGTAYDGNYWHYDTDGKTPVIWKKEN